MGVPNDQKNLLGSKDDLELILSRLLAAAQKIGVWRIALAGQLPSIIKRQGLVPDPSIVSGVVGAVFVVTACLREVFALHKLSNDARIVVFGAGLVGSALIAALKSTGHNVNGLDAAPRGQDIQPLSSAEDVLQCADVVILLSARGSDFGPYLRFLKDGAVIVDDTHPALPRARFEAARTEAKDVTYYKAVASNPRLQVLPSLPGYGADWVPGCALEGIVLAGTDDEDPITQAFFDIKATRLGFRGLLAGWQT